MAQPAEAGPWKKRMKKKERRGRQRQPFQMRISVLLSKKSSAASVELSSLAGAAEQAFEGLNREEGVGVGGTLFPLRTYRVYIG